MGGSVVTQEEIERECGEIGSAISDTLPIDAGFVLVVVDGGNRAYSTSLRRKECARLLSELTKHLERKAG